MTKLIKCKNPDCRKLFEKKYCSKFCCPQCTKRVYYLTHKKEIIRKNLLWAEKNPEKTKECHKKAFAKFYTEKRPRFLELMRASYKRNKIRWDCRTRTRYYLINNKLQIDKACKFCGTTENLSRRFEKFAITKHEIQRIIEKGYIYNICSRCRSIQNIQNKRKT